MKNEISLVRPRTIDELDSVLLQSNESWTFLAGGTDLLVQKDKWRKATHLVDLTSLPALHQTIEVQPDIIRIGAAVPYGEIIRHALLPKRLPILTYACEQIGAVQIQNRGTIGGNIANASPAGDTLPVLAVLNAELLIGPRKNGAFKRISLNDIMTGPGQIALEINEYIAFIEIPTPPENPLWDFRKIGQRQALAISKLSLAVLLWKDHEKVKDVRIASGSVAPVIRRHLKTEAALKGRPLSAESIARAAEILKTEINPISDIRSDKEYRRQITANVLMDILHQWL